MQPTRLSFNVFIKTFKTLMHHPQAILLLLLFQASLTLLSFGSSAIVPYLTSNTLWFINTTVFFAVSIILLTYFVGITLLISKNSIENGKNAFFPRLGWGKFGKLLMFFIVFMFLYAGTNYLILILASLIQKTFALSGVVAAYFVYFPLLFIIYAGVLLFLLLTPAFVIVNDLPLLQGLKASIVTVKKNYLLVFPCLIGVLLLGFVLSSYFQNSSLYPYIFAVLEAIITPYLLLFSAYLSLSTKP